MESGVNIVMLGAALAVLLALGRGATPEPEPVVLRIDDEPDPARRS